MSLVYLLKKDPTDENDFDSTWSVDFDSDDLGRFSVISFRAPLDVVQTLLQKPTLYIPVGSNEIRALLRAVVENENEDQRTKSIARTILGVDENGKS